MKQIVLALIFIFTTQSLYSEIRTFDGGTFSVEFEYERELWRIDGFTDLNSILFEMGDPESGYSHLWMTVFMDRFKEPPGGNDIKDWFAQYLIRKAPIIERHLYRGDRHFEHVEGNPVTRGEKTLLRFNMVPKPTMASRNEIRGKEKGMIYFLIPPQFEKHDSFFVFAGRQVVSQLGEWYHNVRHSRVKLNEIVDRIISGLALNNQDFLLPEELPEDRMKTFNGGGFSVDFDVEPHIWNIEANPNLVVY